MAVVKNNWLRLVHQRNKSPRNAAIHFFYDFATEASCLLGAENFEEIMGRCVGGWLSRTDLLEHILSWRFSFRRPNANIPQNTAGY